MYIDINLSMVGDHVMIHMCITLYISDVGKRSTRWSAVTVRLALAYGALNSFGLLQLPSRSTLQSYTGAFLEDSGKLHVLLYPLLCVCVCITHYVQE